MDAVITQQPLMSWEDSLLRLANRVEQSATSKSGRKQHRSCDQCRKGKRGCDAVIPRTFANSPESQSFGFGGYHGLPLGPCSNCAKTSKGCTFEWLRSQERDRYRRLSDVSGASSKRRRLSITESHSNMTRLDSLLLDGSDSPLPSKSKGSHRTQSRVSPVPSFCQTTRPLPASEHSYDDISEGGNDFVSQHWNEGTFHGGSFNQSNSLSRLDSIDSTNTGFDSLSERTNNSITSSDFSELPQTVRRRTGYDPNDNKRQGHRVANISSFSIPEKLVTFTNKSIVTESLMKVYHDSLENALSCWLTERTCPYGSSPEGARSAGGPNWSNRICSQVFDLDRRSAAIQNRPLTRSEDRAATNALNMAIMAFATQWSQSSARSRAKFNSFGSHDLFAENSSTKDSVNSDYTESAMDFDRTLQESSWAQARSAIQNATHIESFRVVFAHIIFSLTQRPLSVDENYTSTPCGGSSPFPSNENTFSAPTSEANGHMQDRNHMKSRLEAICNHSGLMEEIDGVIDRDGPPVFLEQGLRHIHSLRSKLNGLKREPQRTKDGSTASEPQKSESKSTLLTQDNWKTIDLLYWLGVMFDTLSAAMNKRPLVVSDEDSDIYPETHPNLDCSYSYEPEDESLSNRRNVREKDWPSSAESSKLWNSFFFQAQEIRIRSLPIRWPCSYENAATTLADAAPIKVLLFRKVTRIQTLLSRHASRNKLEDAIKDALFVYRYWNTVYGPFIVDCIDNHDQLPARIQSWYICLTGHWHLAVLLLADIIQSIDGQLGIGSNLDKGKSSGLVIKLRQNSTNAVADLARCACPREDSSFPDADFHFAVNQGAILTEPWTQVLIRVFSKAAALLLVDATNANGGTDHSYKKAMQRGEECVEALWYLGKKSDIAFLTARILSRAMKRSMENVANTETSRISRDWVEAGFSLQDDFSFSVPSSESEDSFQRVGGFDFGIPVEDTVPDYFVDSRGLVADLYGSEAFL